jgi:hypothetical protein
MMLNSPSQMPRIWVRVCSKIALDMMPEGSIGSVAELRAGPELGTMIVRIRWEGMFKRETEVFMRDFSYFFDEV